MIKRTVSIGVLVGTATGIVAAWAFGPDGWLLGGGIAGAVVGTTSPDLAAGLFHGAGAGGLAGLAFAIVFGLGVGVRFALVSGEPAMLAWGLNPFFAVAIVYGTGCAVVGSIVGGVACATRDR